jgi:hypothetical protein
MNVIMAQLQNYHLELITATLTIPADVLVNMYPLDAITVGHIGHTFEISGSISSKLAIFGL